MVKVQDSVAITFDDAFKNVHDVALPILKKYVPKENLKNLNGITITKTLISGLKASLDTQL